MDCQTQEIIKRLDMTRLPRHIAIIMDGNGRWAMNRELPRSDGHYQGVTSVRTATELCSDLGIGYLTLYAFSTENWDRPAEEVDILMHLIGMAIENEMPSMLKNNVRFNMLGDIDRIPDEPKKRLLRCKEATSHCTGLRLNVCLSYSSRWELTRTMMKIAEKVKSGDLRPDDITESTIDSNLVTAGIPDPDLLIRTGGEFRISNYLLWQIAYSELYFTPTLWPDFDKEALADAISDFQHRERRYGKTSQQVTHDNHSN